MNVILEVVFNIIVIIFIMLVLSCKLGCYIIKRQHEQYIRQVNTINTKVKIINDMKNEILKND